MQLFRRLGLGLLDLLLPPRCHICRNAVSSDRPLHICSDCHAALPFILPPACSVCGIPMAGAGTDHPCGHCIATPPPYRAARAALSYQGACRDLIQAFKYRQKSHLRRPLGLLLAHSLKPFAEDQQPDLLVPVPLHVSRLRQRGFNQAVLLAEILSEQWHIPLLRQGLQRTRATTPQVALTRDQRICNLRDAFQTADSKAIIQRRIMLVDDVFTTGSTLRECATVLLQAGCLEVSAVTVAHAP
jgi:ComF family protein